MTVRFQDYRQHVRDILQAALLAADPAEAVKEQLRREGRYLFVGPYRFNLNHGRIFVIAVGKAALEMGTMALQIIDSGIAGGIFVRKKPNDGARERHSYQAQMGGDVPVTVFEAGHPIPDESSIAAGRAVRELLRGAAVGDLVLCLISGGASSLLSIPALSLPQWQLLTQVLLHSGCTIAELNQVRSHLDELKGGGLAEAALPASVASLILSDVVGNPVHAIGSGLTAVPPDSAGEALTVLHRHGVANRLPIETWDRITQHVTNARRVRSVARFGDLEVKNIIVADVGRAAAAGAKTAAKLGFEATVLTSHLEGEAREVGRVIAAIARDAAPGRCLLFGGETTVTVRGDGQGGRNLELALAAALSIVGQPDRIIVTFATDGEDGTTGAAGAIVTGSTVAEARAAGLVPTDYLARNDSYTFFRRLGEETGSPALIQTGPTGTNVNDLVVALAY